MSYARPLWRHTLPVRPCSQGWHPTSGLRVVVLQRRGLQTTEPPGPHEAQDSKVDGSKLPKFGFAFDIDGVLIRGSKALSRAKAALLYLNLQKIPFMLLTNGGGMSESRRARNLGQELRFTFRESQILQSHTPFKDMEEYKDGNVLVCGGTEDKCRAAARKYGFKNVILPSDIWTARPDIWPFSRAFEDWHKRQCRPQDLPTPITPSDPSKSLKIDAIFVYNDPRDWSLDLTIILDLLLSKDGVLGTLSPKNGNKDLPNKGYQQDGQPPLFFSNPDLWFAADFELPRLGQGGFRAALDGLWNEVTNGAKLEKTVIGKPYQHTYEFAEKVLNAHNQNFYAKTPDVEPLANVYMVGDNPESDIRGANNFKSPLNTKWHSILLRTGVYSGGTPSAEPTTIVNDVYDAVRWAAEHAGWPDLPPEDADEILKLDKSSKESVVDESGQDDMCEDDVEITTVKGHNGVDTHDDVGLAELNAFRTHDARKDVGLAELNAFRTHGVAKGWRKMPSKWWHQPLQSNTHTRKQNVDSNASRTHIISKNTPIKESTLQVNEQLNSAAPEDNHEDSHENEEHIGNTKSFRRHRFNVAKHGFDVKRHRHMLDSKTDVKRPVKEELKQKGAFRRYVQFKADGKTGYEGLKGRALAMAIERERKARAGGAPVGVEA